MRRVSVRIGPSVPLRRPNSSAAEHVLGKDEAGGSTPPSGTTIIAVLGRALVS